MRKEYVIGGLVFWASVSGWMGLRVLESYTEDAVYAVLSVVPAEAKEIRYNFLTDDLRITGIEYEIPHETIVHRGTIDSVEISKFHRKIMYVKPKMPPYSADELPRVGEDFKIRGVVDRVHEGHSVMETKIGSIDMRNWYQRVGMVLDNFARKGVGEAFFEELFRMHVEELGASQIEVTLNDPELDGPVTFRADSLTVPGGIPAPRGVEKTVPVNMVLDRVAYSRSDISASAGRVDISALRAPEPDKMGRIAELARALREGKEGASSEDLLLTLMTSWDKYAPVGSVSLQNVIVKPAETGQAVTAGSLSYALKRSGETWSDTFKCRELNLRPELFAEQEELVKRYAPEGLKLNVESSSTSDESSVKTESSYEVAGLGRLRTSTALEGEFGKLRKLCMTSDVTTLDPFALAFGLKVHKVKAQYSDSGLLPLVFSAVAMEMGLQPEELTREAASAVAGMTGNKALREFGEAISEQLQKPGEIEFELAPEKPMSVKELTTSLMLNPASVPLNMSSKPGTKSMQEYFSGK